MLETIGIDAQGNVHRNLDIDALIERAVDKGEGKISKVGALTVTTGKYTGRSPNDKFIVQEDTTKDKISWGKVNVPISEEKFDRLYDKITKYLSQKDELFVFDGFAGADTDHQAHFRIINELASHNLFITQLLRRPTPEELKTHRADFVIISAPGCKADPATDGTNSEAFIVVNLKKRLIIIGGTSYAGEMKKSVFSVMNFLLPEKDVFPMHCSANVGKEGDVALFFGLSGTGKTTLSADESRSLIGDDEHGWSENGIFNFEGGCYAKCINLSKEKEPQIWDAIKRGALVENVIMHPETGEYDFTDSTLTENTRVGYPIDFIPGAELSGIAGHPKTIIFLTADAFGVMPPVSKLTHEQAMYHFMSGYTSKLAGTERGITEPKATFSSFFGDPFMPLKPMIYANLLKKYISTYKTNVFLINTGWTGGPYGVGQRMDLNATRAMVTAALEGKFDDVDYALHPVFNVMVPKECPGVDSNILDPKNTWEDKSAYDEQAKKLASMFVENFKKFKDIPQEVITAGPKA